MNNCPFKFEKSKITNDWIVGPKFLSSYAFYFFENESLIHYSHLRYSIDERMILKTYASNCLIGYNNE